MARVGQKLKKLREARGLQGNELAAMAGITPSYISQVERGVCATPSLKVLRKLGEALKVRWTSLL